MKKGIALLTAILAMASAGLQAEYELEDASSLEIQPVENNGSPFEIQITGDWLSKAKFDKDDASGHIRFDHAQAVFDAVVCYNECYKEGVMIGLGYEYTRLDWEHNPYFKRKNYDTAVLSTIFFTERYCDWRWLTSLSVNFDADKWVFRDYTTYDILLWGRYAYNCNVNLHLGIYAETGMKLDRVYPVIGFDWQISKKWQLNAIFPLNVALVYTVNPCWSIALAGRIFSDRHRAGKEGLLSEKSVWRYSNAGAEFAINRTFCDWLKANAHVGYAFGGRLKVANRHSHDSHNFDFKSSGYVGGALTINF